MWNKSLDLKTEILSGLTVALALIPESVAFAFVAGVSPILSLQTAVVMGLVAAIFTGQPGMISSSTAAISVVFASLISKYGLDYLFATVILMGVIQILLGVFKLGKYTRIIPYSVMLGFLNGLSIVMFLAQFSQFKVNKIIMENGVEVVKSVWLPTKDLGTMIGFVALTMLIVHLFPKISKKIPSSLVAILILTLISITLSKTGIYSLRTVQDFAGMELHGDLPKFYIPHVKISLNMLKIIFPYAIIGGLVGLTEAVLTGRVIDEMTDIKGKTNKEFFAQGIANVINGFFGGMGGDAMIGQSIINIKSGGRTRITGMVAAVALMFFIMYGSAFVNAIPLASLVGVMFMVVIGTFKWESLKYGGKVPKHDIAVVIVVSLITVFKDLASAVIIGIILAALIFAWEKGKILYSNTDTDSKGRKRYKINGTLFFGSVFNFNEIFDINTDPQEVVLDLKYSRVMDHSAIEAINNIAQRYEERGKKLIVIRPSKECRMLLKNARDITSIYIEDHIQDTHSYEFLEHLRI